MARKQVKPKYVVEMTDTFGGEANYSWIRNWAVSASSPRGAITKVAKQTGYRFRNDGIRYNAQGACVCAFVNDASEYSAEYVDALTKL